MKLSDFRRKTRRLFREFGLDFKKFRHSVKGIYYYFSNLNKLKQQKKTSSEKFNWGQPYPCLGDRFAKSGAATGHYFNQDLLVARRVFNNQPHLHVDIGSRIDGFVAHIASFRKIEVFDIRPLSNGIPNITFKQADMMNPINDELKSYCDSLSCLHAVEHFGLGRYGDPINYEGHLYGLNNLYDILKSNGKLYFSVPIGPQRIEFDAHRVFSVAYLLNIFKDKYNLDHFSYVDDKGNLHEDVELNEDEINDNFGCNYGCGIFEMTKI